MAWHDGIWWPLYTTAWYSPQVSQYMFDPYSLTHILHGIIFHLILSNIFQSSLAGFLITMAVELVWEVVENSEPVMRRFRENSGTSGDYEGDSVQNIIGDLLACAAGNILAIQLQVAGVIWVSFVWVVVSEVACIVYMRDSLFLIMVALLYKSEHLVEWQAQGMPKKKEEVKG